MKKFIAVVVIAVMLQLGVVSLAAAAPPEHGPNPYGAYHGQCGTGYYYHVTYKRCQPVRYYHNTTYYYSYRTYYPTYYPTYTHCTYNCGYHTNYYYPYTYRYSRW
jgi:hypothetical protein